jgi:hypothetical protein
MAPDSGSMGIVGFSDQATKVVADVSSLHPSHSILEGFMESFPATTEKTAIGKGLQAAQALLDNVRANSDSVESILVFTDVLQKCLRLSMR